MASELIGTLYPTEIPGYVDSADIQAAFRLYHYGSLSYDIENSDTAQLVNPSIAYTLNDLQSQIDGLDPAGSVSLGTVASKGDLIVGLSSGAVDNLPVGSNNYVLMADSTQTLGIKWSALSGATTSSPGVVQLNDTYTSTSTTQAATANALKSVYDLKEDKALTIKTQSGTIYQYIATDAQSKLIKFTSSSNVSTEIPASTFSAGDQINITGVGAGQVSVSPGSGVTLYSTPSSILRAQYSAGTIVCLDPSTFIMYGDLKP